MILLGNGGQLLLGIFKEDLIFKAPPIVPIAVVHGAIVPSGEQIVNFVDAVGLKIGLSAAKTGIRTHHQRLIIALRLQNGGQAGDTGQKFSLCAIAVLPVGDAVGDFQGNTGGVTHHSANGPAGAGDLPETADGGVVGEIDVVLGQLGQFGDQIIGQRAAQIFGKIAGFHGFQHNVDEIPLFLGEGDGDTVGIFVFILIQRTGAIGVDEIIHQFHIEGGIEKQAQTQGHGQQAGDPAGNGEQGDAADAEQGFSRPKQRQDHQYGADQCG